MPQVPVSHFLIGPPGILVIEVRHQEGEVFVKDDEWQRRPGIGAFLRGVAEGRLGNPSRDAARDEAALGAYLAERVGPELAESVPVQGSALFVNPRVQLVVEDPSIPVLIPRNLKQFVREGWAAGRARLDDEALRA